MRDDRSTPGRGRPRVLSDEQILDAALTAFGRHGYDGVSLRSVNRTLGASPAMLAKRFGTKDDLWHAALEHGFGRHRELMLAELAEADLGEPSLELLRRYVEAFVRTASRLPQLHQIVNAEGANESARVDLLYERFVDPLLHDVVRPTLDALQRQGVVRPVSDREVFFLVANGAAAVCALGPLNERFERRDGPFDLDRYASAIADLLVGSITAG